MWQGFNNVLQHFCLSPTSKELCTKFPLYYYVSNCINIFKTQLHVSKLTPSWKWCGQGPNGTYLSLYVVFISINIPCWDSQCSTMECANITHSLIGLYLAGNVCKVDTQCPSMECANNCTLCKRTLGLRWVTTFELGKLILWSFLSAKHFCSFSVSFMTNLRDSLLFVCALWKKQTASYYFFRTFID